MSLFNFKIEYDQSSYYDNENEYDVINLTQITVSAPDVKQAREKIKEFMIPIFQQNYKYCSNKKAMVDQELEILNKNLEKYTEGEEIVYIPG